MKSPPSGSPLILHRALFSSRTRAEQKRLLPPDRGLGHDPGKAIQDAPRGPARRCSGPPSAQNQGPRCPTFVAFPTRDLVPIPVQDATPVSTQSPARTLCRLATLLAYRKTNFLDQKSD